DRDSFLIYILVVVAVEHWRSTSIPMVRICFLIVSSTVGSGVDYEGDSSVGEGRSEVYGVGDYDGGVDGEGNFLLEIYKSV
ncbi:hypothetical protein Tco_1116041, partial [Tanacetum coccineum]